MNIACAKCGLEMEWKRKGRRCKKCIREVALADFHKRNQSPQYREQRRISHGEWRRTHPANAMCISAKQRAKNNKLEFDIVPDDIQIPNVCPVLGIPLIRSPKQCDNSPTLDRIDNSKGYVKGNICVISWRANTLKKDATLDELEKLAYYVRSHTKPE